MKIAELCSYAEKVLSGGEITPEEGERLITLPDTDTPLLLALAGSLACSGANGVPSHIVQPLPRELDPRLEQPLTPPSHIVRPLTEEETAVPAAVPKTAGFAPNRLITKRISSPIRCWTRPRYWTPPKRPKKRERPAFPS